MTKVSDEMREAHDQGRVDTRHVIKAGEMSHEYALKLVKGSCGLAIWLAVGSGLCLYLLRGWHFWSALLGAFAVWVVGSFLLTFVHTGTLMLIWWARRIAARRSGKHDTDINRGSRER